MTRKDINKLPFHEATLLKLGIFRKCFREWYPVFLHNSAKQIFIFDMFAGSGTDSEGKPGSPIILLEEALGKDLQYCRILKEKDKKVSFWFNEKDEKKKGLLQQSVNKFFSNCKLSCHLGKCSYQGSVNCTSDTFEKIVKSDAFEGILANENYGKFVLLDQYGFSQITEEIFLKLVNSPKTDFIFFISSSFIKRFRDQGAVKAYINTNKLNFKETKPQECHRIIARYFRDLIPKDKDYYIHHFTIKKGSNYYGLIFGTSHSLGMEKFVKVCWAEDKSSGESNCNIDNDYEEGSLFYDKDNTTKKSKIKTKIEKLILAGEIKTNSKGLKCVLKQGCEPKLFTEVVCSLLNQGKIEIKNFNKQSSNIHRVKEYFIKVI